MMGRRMIAVLGWTLVVAAPLSAQLSDSDSREMARLPAPPADHILDETGLFTRQPDRREAIAARLGALQDAHDLPVYLVVYGSLIDSTVSRRARLLYDAWVGRERDGIVIVYETDSGRREIVTPGSHHAVPGEGGAGAVSRLPDHRMAKILAAVDVTLEGVEDRVDLLDRTTEILAARVDELLREEAPAMASGSSVKVIAIVLGAAFLLGLAGLFLHRRLRAAEARARECFYFPDVMVGTRLGAPFAGGRHSVVNFSRDRPPRI